jgi:hypothetical protein
MKLGMSVQESLCDDAIGIGILRLDFHLVVGKSFEFVVLGDDLIEQLE